jgi:hypothetical protein
MVITNYSYDSIIGNAAIKYGVPVPLIRAFIMKESAWNPNAYHLDKNKDGTTRVDKYGRPSESVGLMQIILGTAEWMLNKPVGSITLNSLYAPSLNLEVGVKYIAYQLKTQGGNIKKAIAGYNSGTPRYTFNGDFINQQYVDQIWGYYQEYLTADILISSSGNDNLSDYQLPTPYITMEESVDTTQAENATVGVSNMPADVENTIKAGAEQDDPGSIEIPFNPLWVYVGLGLLLFGGGLKKILR